MLNRRTAKTRKHWVPALMVGCLSACVLTTPAWAADKELVTVEEPAGQICQFPVRVDYLASTRTEWGGGVLYAGSYGPTTVTNLATGDMLTLPVRGAQGRVVSTEPDGTRIETANGNTLLGLYPTDDPAGPSLFLYTGKVTISVSPDADYTIIKQRGTKRDICAALS